MDPSMLAALQGQGQGQGPPPKPAGQVDDIIDLVESVDLKHSSVLNASPQSELPLILKAGASDLCLTSNPEVDEQLLISVEFANIVKLRSIMFKATNGPPDASGPKHVKIFQNRRDMDFGSAEDSKALAEFDLTPSQLSGEERVDLPWVKLQHVSTITIFVETNQADEEVTFINHINFYGRGIHTTDVTTIRTTMESH